jgi:hypothetical protein
LLNVSNFLQKRLTFQWRSGDGRIGFLPQWVLPDDNILDDLKIEHPAVAWDFRRKKGAVVKTLPLNEALDLVITFGGCRITYCSLDLGKFVDRSFGVLWDGRLSRSSEKGAAEFVYPFCFTKAGDFEFRLKFETVEKAVGQDVMVIRTHDSQ